MTSMELGKDSQDTTAPCTKAQRMRETWSTLIPWELIYCNIIYHEIFKPPEGILLKITTLLLIQDYAMRYWRDNGTPVEKLRMGFASYGRTFRLTSADTSVGAPASGPASAGTYSREAGFWSYYEVRALESFFLKQWNIFLKVSFEYSQYPNTVKQYFNICIDLWIPKRNNTPVDWGSEGALCHK